MRKKQENTIINKESAVFIATFSRYEKGKRLPTNGMVEPMLSFFLTKVKSLLLLDQPHLVSDTLDPIIEIYKKNKLKKEFKISKFLYLPIYLLCKIPSQKETRVSYKLRDFFSVLYAAYINVQNYELFVGLEGINALAGIVLRKMGKVKRVVYYVSDYSPTRYGKTFFNSLYLWLDKYCVAHADFTWDVSPAMKEGRLSVGLSKQNAKKIIHVPNGLFNSQVDPLPISKRVRDRILFLGIFDSELGLDLAIKALKIVRVKKPDSTLQIIGGTRDEIYKFKQIVENLDLEKWVNFYGLVSPEKMSDIVRKCYIGIAPYRTFKTSRRKYGDSGKIRVYMGCGLPFVSTNYMSHISYAISQGAGIAIKDTEEDLAKGILKLLENDSLYRKCSIKAIELSKNNTWENTYANALRRMETLLLKDTKN